MKLKSYVVLGYALLLFIGGLIGFFKAGSLPSLIMGSVFAAILILCAVQMLKYHAQASTWAFYVTIALMLFFSFRFAMTFALFPAGFMSIVSMVVAVFLKAEPEKLRK